MKQLLLLISLLLAFHISQATHEVKGSVLSLDDEPIGGVNVLVKGTPFGVTTNMSGEFTITVPEGPVILLFSLVKFRPIEYSLVVRDGFRYQITVFLARKNQSFNKSHSLAGELPLDAPVVTGVLTDATNRPLTGVKVAQAGANFTAFTDRVGKFAMPVPYGKNKLSFFLSGFKTLSVSIDVGVDLKTQLEIVLAANQDAGKSSASIRTLP
jgi:hypothetical protein